MEIADKIAYHSMKVVKWPKEGPQRVQAEAALQKEIDSLCKWVLVPIPKGHKLRANAKAEAVTGRALCDIKRNTNYKGRIVKHGFKEDKVAMDGPNFNYQSHVCEFISARASILRSRRGNRRLAQLDVATAFLQSLKY